MMFVNNVSNDDDYLDLYNTKSISRSLSKC